VEILRLSFKKGPMQCVLAPPAPTPLPTPTLA